MEIPDGLYAVIGAMVGGGIGLIASRLSSKSQKEIELNKLSEAQKQVAFKEIADKAHRFSESICSANYWFLSITWSADKGRPEKETIDQYFEHIQEIMPRLYADYILLAGADDELGDAACRLFDQADALDADIGEAVANPDTVDVKEIALLRREAINLRESILNDLIASLTKRRRESPA